MNGVRNLLHNMKIETSKTFLSNSNARHSAWSSDLHMGISRHASFLPVLSAAGVRCQPWLGSSIPWVHVPRLALWTLGKELFCLIWRDTGRGHAPISTSLFLRQIRAFDCQCNSGLKGKEINPMTSKKNKWCSQILCPNCFLIIRNLLSALGTLKKYRNYKSPDLCLS